MPSASSKRVPWILAIFGVAAIGYAFFKTSGHDRPAEVSIAHASRQELSAWISSNGKVEPIDPHVLQSQLTAFISKVLVKEGQPVTQGQTLLTFDVRDLRFQKDQREAQLKGIEEERKNALRPSSPAQIDQIDGEIRKAELEIKNRQNSLDKLQGLRYATREELDVARHAVASAEADLKTLQNQKTGLIREADRASKEKADLLGPQADEARSRIGSLDLQLASENLSAPVSGTLYVLSAHSGAFVHTGDALGELANLKQVRVRAFVDEPDLGSLSPGQPVEITWDAAPGRKWMGKVEQLPKTIVTRGTRSVGEVLCSVENDDLQLLPNTNVNVRIRAAERQNVLSIPRSAVRTDGDKRYVFVIDQEKLQRRDVTLGISNALFYEVLNGVNETDRIATSGAAELRDGLPVSAKEQ
jgi:HlyD family secretion protein